MTPLAAGWCVPNPVKASRFASLFPEHAIHNVEIDLGAIGAFGAAATTDAVLHADLQTLPGYGQGVMLGSGRSGFHLGKYVKGAGRTSLAGNWSREDQIYHGTGHLMPTAAIRELVVSRYLAKRGLTETIVPCEGLLLAPLAPALEGFLERAFPPDAAIAPIDRALQAITVKPGGFARFSNFLWLLDHPSRRTALDFFKNLKWALRLEADDPASFARAIAGQIDATIPRAAAWWRAGVYWGSFNNNSTIDGRFLDLEVATLFGRSVFGILLESSQPDPQAVGRALLMGCEGLVQLKGLKVAIGALRRRLEALLEAGLAPQAIERRYITEFLSALDEGLRASLLEDRDRTITAVAGSIGEELGRQGDPLITGLVGEQWDNFLGSPGAPRPAALARVPIELARSECARFRAWSPIAAGDSFEEGARLNRRLDEIAELRTVDEALPAIRALVDEV